MFKDIINKVSYLDVFKSLLKNYPDLSHSTIVAHLKVMMDLRDMEPKQTDITIHCEWVNPSEIDDVGYWLVHGKSDTIFPGCDLALDYTPWLEWLGMECVVPYGLEEHEFVAHCLYEMTFFGFKMDDVEKQRVALEEQIEDCVDELPWVDFNPDRDFISLSS